MKFLNADLSDERRARRALLGLGIAGAAMIIVGVSLLALPRFGGLHLQLPRLALKIPLPARGQAAASTAAPLPANIVFPSPTSCGEAKLVIGGTTFRVQPLSVQPGSPLSVPEGDPDIAYWVEGTTSNRVFALSLAQESLTADSIHQGDEASLTWTDCNTSTFTLADPETGAPDEAALMDQTSPGITLYSPGATESTAFWVRGGVAGEVLNTIPTADLSQIIAEVGVLETATSSDEKTISISVTVHNVGEKDFTLSAGDVSLTQQDGTPLALESSKPSLPRELAPGKMETFQFTFPRPATPIATLSVLGVQYDVEAGG